MRTILEKNVVSFQKYPIKRRSSVKKLTDALGLTEKDEVPKKFESNEKVDQMQLYIFAQELSSWTVRF